MGHAEIRVGLNDPGGQRLSLPTGFAPSCATQANGPVPRCVTKGRGAAGSSPAMTVTLA